MSSVAIISVPNIFVKITSPIVTGAFTEVFRIISITSEIFSFGTGLAVLTLTIAFSRFSTRTMLVTVRVGWIHSSIPYFSPLGQLLPETVDFSPSISTQSEQPRGGLSQRICHLIAQQFYPRNSPSQ